MRLRFLATLLVLVLSAILVGLVYAGVNVSGRYSSSSLHVDGQVTGSHGLSVDALTVDLDAFLHGVAECNGEHFNFSNAMVSGSTDSVEIHQGQQAEFTIEVGDNDIEEAIEAVVHCDVDDWLVETLNAILTLKAGDVILDTTESDCKVNFNRPTNEDDTRNANCHIVN